MMRILVRVNPAIINADFFHVLGNPSTTFCLFWVARWGRPFVSAYLIFTVVVQLCGRTAKQGRRPAYTILPHTGSHPRPALQHSKSYSVSSSSRPVAQDFRRPILEEGDESTSDSPNEPVTPVNERTSREFQNDVSTSADNSLSTFAPLPPPDAGLDRKPAALVVDTATPSPGESPTRPGSPPAANQDDLPATPLQRRATRSSTTSLKGGIRKTMSFFRRSNSQSDKLTFAELPTQNGTSDTNLNGSQPRETRRRFSMNRSSATTQSNTPPSPGSPLEMAVTTKEAAARPTVPDKVDFVENQRKKNRASTGFSVFFASAGNGARRPKTVKRSSSYHGLKDAAKPREDDKLHAPSKAFAIPAEEGAGMKARRMSLSLPDDFTVDVGNLTAEFEYPNKLLGRHGKHLGKGATSKVIIMARKSFHGELYAVKEFRPRSHKETQEEYEKKVKSEYSIAKSLHHPNIVETIRLCVDDKGRWNHVMEYCSDGDIFTLVEKKWFMGDAKQGDRLCLFKQLIQGVNYLHSNGIAHRDIKLENLLLTNESKLKITDFGVSEVFCGVHPGLREAGGQCGTKMAEIRLCKPGICGSLPYISPEVLAKQEDYDPRGLDVWGCAIVMLYLIFGGGLWKNAMTTPPQGGEPNYVALVKGWEKWNAKHPEADAQITDTDYPFVQAFDICIKPPVLRRILLQMLNPDPAKRVSVATVVSQKWVKSIECCQLDSYDDPTKYIDASKKNCLKVAGGNKIFCHRHVPSAYEMKSRTGS